MTRRSRDCVPQDLSNTLWPISDVKQRFHLLGCGAAKDCSILVQTAPSFAKPLCRPKHPMHGAWKEVEPQALLMATLRLKPSSSLVINTEQPHRVVKVGIRHPEAQAKRALAGHQLGGHAPDRVVLTTRLIQCDLWLARCEYGPGIRGSSTTHILPHQTQVFFLKKGSRFEVGNTGACCVSRKQGYGGFLPSSTATSRL